MLTKFLERRLLAALICAGMGLSLAACAGSLRSRQEKGLAERLARELIAACPMASPSDSDARDLSASRLSRSELLLSSMGNVMLWGGEKGEGPHRPKENNLTQLDPLVWRNLYASLYMFTGDYRIQREGDYTVIRLPCLFRNALSEGDYPYPFWHSKKKWDNYQMSTDVVLLMEKGKLVAGYRSFRQDPARPFVMHDWDGKWRWTGKDGRDQPHVSLYRYLFSAQNPYLEKLETAYVKLEKEARTHNCFVCHSPDNRAKAKVLTILSLPNQALISRHHIVSKLAEQEMPPATADSLPGIEDDASREKMVALARVFAELGDQAVSYEESSIKKK